MTPFADRLAAAVRAKGTALCVGLDPRWESLPLSLRGRHADPAAACEAFCLRALEVVAPLVPVVKPQSAFFEVLGPPGMTALGNVLRRAKELGLVTILDAKRGDIGSTAEAYAQAYLSPAHAGGTDLEVDCLTVNPFLGPATMEPFVARARDFGKGLFVLVKTSNPDSGWLQDQRLERGSVSELLAGLVARWADATIGGSGVGAVGAVVGATYPEEASRLRKLMPRSTLLAPGLGSQGGDASALSSLTTKTGPVLVSASRGIASVEDRAMPIETYQALARDRIVALAATATLRARTDT